MVDLTNNFSPHDKNATQLTALLVPLPSSQKLTLSDLSPKHAALYIPKSHLDGSICSAFRDIASYIGLGGDALELDRSVVQSMVKTLAYKALLSLLHLDLSSSLSKHSKSEPTPAPRPPISTPTLLSLLKQTESTYSNPNMHFPTTASLLFLTLLPSLFSRSTLSTPTDPSQLQLEPRQKPGGTCSPSGHTITAYKEGSGCSGSGYACSLNCYDVVCNMVSSRLFLSLSLSVLPFVFRLLCSAIRPLSSLLPLLNLNNSTSPALLPSSPLSLPPILNPP